jgi:hypothetical protein
MLHFRPLYALLQPGRATKTPREEPWTTKYCARALSARKKRAETCSNRAAAANPFIVLGERGN